MHIEFLVEEYSAEVALINILPRILGENTAYAIRTFSGKQDLLTQLPMRLKGYRKWKPEDGRIVVLVDQDRENCLDLKAKLEEAAKDAGFTTKSAARGRRGFDVINRLAIEELEAWFFGDPKAIVQAYPRVPATIGSKAPYRNPDAIVGGTWETLERVLQKAGYYPGGMPKAETAEKISKYMDQVETVRKASRCFEMHYWGFTYETNKRMTAEKKTTHARIKAFVGQWHIVEMEAWDQEYVNMEVTGHFTFHKDGSGHFQFGLVQGEMDCRVETTGDGKRIEFSWEGQEELDPANGRGWAVIEDEELKGRIFFHQGDDSGFRTRRS